MARVLLTGATGFVGKQILRRLIEQGHEVLALIRPGRQGSAARLASLGLPVGAPVQAVAGDLTAPALGLSPTDWETARTVEIIIHAGSPMQLTLTAAEADAQILQATDRVLELAELIQRQRGLGRFVHLVGFMSPIHADDAKADLDVEALLPSAAPYERAKFLADLRVRQAANRVGFPLTVVHPGTVIGSSQTGETEQTTGFGLMVDAVRRGLMGAVPGGADHWLPLVTVDDLARLTVDVATRAEAVGQTVYALDRNGPNMVELLGALAAELRMPRPRFTVPVGVLRSLMVHGGGKLTRVLPQSLDFVTTQRFPDAVAYTRTREILPAVIADIDYRLARKGAPSPTHSLQRVRLGRMAGLWRPGTGTPWVILHGLFSSADELAPLAEALGNAPVYLLDLPGFGRSPLPHVGQGFEHGQVDAVMGALGGIPGRVRLVGHSFGALIAARVAAQRPEKIEALHLLQPPLRRPKLPWPLPMTGRFPRVTRSLLRFGVTPSALMEGFRPAGAGAPAGYVERTLADLSSPRVRYATAQSFLILTAGYAGIALGEIKVPVHLIWGTEDDGYPVAWGRQAVTEYAHVWLTAMSAGHQFPLSHPLETAAVLLQQGGQTLSASR
jgi:nucleoside-diphosphate-sugar epimerase/pimeloyl-ACP methyl ester carboxylesterase